MGTMGSGVEAAIRTRFPVVRAEYVRFCKNREIGSLLGEIQIVPINRSQSVINIFGQLEYGRDRTQVYTDYTALEVAFNKIRTQSHNKSLAFPYKFGCGLANGDWNIVSGLITKYLGDMDITIYKLPE